MSNKNKSKNDEDPNGCGKLPTPENSWSIPIDEIVPPENDGHDYAVTKIKADWARVSEEVCRLFLKRLLSTDSPQLRSEEIDELKGLRLRMVCQDVLIRFNTLVDCGSPKPQVYQLPASAEINVPSPVGFEQNQGDGKADGGKKERINLSDDDDNVYVDMNENKNEASGGANFFGGGAFNRRNAGYTYRGWGRGNSIHNAGPHPENDLKASYSYFQAANGCSVYAMNQKHAQEVANVAFMKAKSQAIKSFMLNVRTVMKDGVTTYIFCDESGKECRTNQRPSHFDVDDSVDDPGHQHKVFNGEYFPQPPKKTENGKENDELLGMSCSSLPDCLCVCNSSIPMRVGNRSSKCVNGINFAHAAI